MSTLAPRNEWSYIAAMCGSLFRALILVAAWWPIHALAWWSCSSDLSGTDMPSGPTVVALLQIVENGRTLTDRYEEFVVHPDSELGNTNAAVSGDTDGGRVALTVRPNALVAPSVTVSGTVDSQQLHVTGTSTALHIARADRVAVQVGAARTRRQSDQMLFAKTHAEFVVEHYNAGRVPNGARGSSDGHAR